MSNKLIHIEKYDIKEFHKQKKPYAMILTDVIQRTPHTRIKEIFLWIFLESLPDTWVPNKKHITSHFGISDRTYERYMSYLNASKLIEYRQLRNKDGSFGEWKLIILNGSKFEPEAVSHRTAKIDGADVNRDKNEKVIHIFDSHRSAKNGGTVDQLQDTENNEEKTISPFRHFAVERLDVAHINTTSKNKEERKKTNNPVSVFLDKQNVKEYIENVVSNRKDQEPLDDEVIDQGVYYAYEKNDDKSFDSVNKRINIFLKKVREGKWLIPQGWNGITSQSIRKEEEEHDKLKKEQYRQDAKIFREIRGAVLSECGAQALGDIFRKLGINAQ